LSELVPGSTAPRTVDVVILNWNGRELLRPCLRSVVASEYPLHRIIVADNGSTDGSVEMLEQEFPTVNVVRNGRNLGAPSGRNTGIAESMKRRPDYIYTLDNDLTIHPRAIGELVELLECHARVGCAGSIIYDSDRPNRILAAGHFVDWTQNLVTPRAVGKVDRGQFEPLAEVDGVGTGAMLTRAKVFDELGLLDDSFIGYGYEDTDFSMRVRGAGYKVVCYAPSKVWHRPFSSIGAYSFKKKYLESRNAIQFLRRYGTRKSWIKFALYAVGGLGYATVREGLRGNMGGVVGKARGLWDGLRGREDLAYQLLREPRR
jgi:GT2 family glycosyltransferase